ncbi:MAG: VOC family protein [Congregibacter sp.]
MATLNLAGFAEKSLDHFVLLVRDLDLAASSYERLGFHVRPLAEHKDLGTRNRVLHFGHTYLELFDATSGLEDVVKPYLDRFQSGEGVVHVSLTSEHLEDDWQRMSAAGVDVHPILSARREITLPDGTRGETASRCFYQWRSDSRYLSLFFSDHPKPKMIFIPEYVCHPNGAREVSRCVYMSTTLNADRDYFSKCFMKNPDEETSERLAWRGARGDLTEVLTVNAAQQRYGDLLSVTDPAPFAGLGIALHYVVDNLDDCRGLLQTTDASHCELYDGTIGVAASKATGCVVCFE